FEPSNFVSSTITSCLLWLCSPDQHTKCSTLAGVLFLSPSLNDTGRSSVTCISWQRRRELFCSAVMPPEKNALLPSNHISLFQWIVTCVGLASLFPSKSVAVSICMTPISSIQDRLARWSIWTSLPCIVSLSSWTQASSRALPVTTRMLPSTK